MFTENDLLEMVEKWSDFNDEISEDEDFDADSFYELYDPTLEMVRECCRKDAHSQANLRLVHELTRFFYKEIYNDEQEECMDSVSVLIDAMCGWNFGYLGLPARKEN